MIDDGRDRRADVVALTFDDGPSDWTDPISITWLTTVATRPSSFSAMQSTERSASEHFDAVTIAELLALGIASECSS